MKKLYIYLQITLLIISSIINFSAYSKGYMPNIIQIFSSTLCILAFIIISLISGYNNEKQYMVFWFLFWGIGVLLFTLGYYTKNFIIGTFPIFLNVGPLYGIKYFMNMSNNYYMGVFIVISMCLTILIFYYIGFLLREKR